MAEGSLGLDGFSSTIITDSSKESSERKVISFNRRPKVSLDLHFLYFLVLYDAVCFNQVEIAGFSPVF